MARLPDIESEQSKLTTVLHAMSDAKRMRILNELSDGKERSVSELEGVIASLSQSALSQHLARLRRANIVRTRRESQSIYYSIDDSDVLRILRLLGHIYTDDPVIQRTSHLGSQADYPPPGGPAKFSAGFCSVFCDNSLPVQNIPRRIRRGRRIAGVLCFEPVNQTRPHAGSRRVIPGK